MMQETEVIKKVHGALEQFFLSDKKLVEDGLCERCLQHRFAVHLENQKFNGYFIDCEYNKSHVNEYVSKKTVSNINGNYIDVIITKRSGDPDDDLVCFEIKRYSNHSGRNKDRENLRILTSGEQFSYDYGFYVILGETQESTVIERYRGGMLQEVSIDGKLKLRES